MNTLLNINYYKFGFGHYWYGHNKRKIGIYCSLPFFILVIIFYIFSSNASLLGFLIIILMDILFIPITLLYLLFRMTFFSISLVDKFVIENIAIIVIFIIINRFILNFLSEKYCGINLNSKSEFHNSPIKK
jgi:prepilin signal peptidase PulO-like enzyme (type II secretory pathway)